MRIDVLDHGRDTGGLTAGLARIAGRWVSPVGDPPLAIDLRPDGRAIVYRDGAFRFGTWAREAHRIRVSTRGEDRWFIASDDGQGVWLLDPVTRVVPRDLLRRPESWHA